MTREKRVQETHSHSSVLTDLDPSGPTTSLTRRLGEFLWRLPAAAMIRVIKLYRLVLSPWIGNQCRFYPSCSHYSEQAIRAHGAVRGSWLTLRRLSKCHPWHEGGCDPVPPPKPNS